MNSMIIEQLKKANVIDSTGKVTLANLATYTLTHDILVVMYDGTVNNITGTYLRAVIEKWTFQDKAMGEQFITFDFLSEQPVAWAVNDYCIFRGERFVLNYIPSVTQKGRRNAVLDSYKYEGIKLNSLADELTRCQMLDVVLTSEQHDPDAGTNYTGSSQFQLFCGETTVNGVTRTAVMTLGDRILANLNRMYGENVWSIVYGDNTHTEDQQLSFDNQYVSEALAEVKNKFDLNYAVKGRTIYIGCELGDVAGVEYGFGPGYPTDEAGGKGLFELKKISDSSQQIVTRLRVLGSTKNLPYRYYNNAYPLPQALFPLNLQLPDTFLPEGSPSDPVGANTKWGHNKQRSSQLRAVKGATNDSYIDKNDDAAGTTEGIREATIRFDGSDSKLEEIYPTIENVTYDELRGSNVPDQDGNTGPGAYPNYESDEKVNEILAIGYKYDGQMFDDANIGSGILSEDNGGQAGSIRDISISQRLDGIRTRVSDYFCGTEQTLFTVAGQTAGRYFFTPVMSKEPYFFYSPASVKDRIGFIIRVKATSGGITTTIAEYKSDFYSGRNSLALPSIPDVFYMMDAQVREIALSGTADITVTFIPCAKASTDILYGVGHKPNSSYTAQYVWNSVDNMDSSGMLFHFFVKDMGFDFAAQFNGETPTIVMKSGECVGREFQIGQSIEKVEYQGKKGYMLTLNRASDSSLNTYYPNARNQISADDQFVITGIDMPDAYIKAAEMRLLSAATEWLAENGNTNFHYQPAIDDIYLKRNYENMVKAGTPQDSVFWKIYAGYDLTFHPIPDNPSDPEPEAISVAIESVTITMGEGLTRKVDILLNDELKESTLKRVSREVKDLSNKIQRTGSGMSSATMETAIRTIGDKQYLSKVENDTAAGDITFNGNIRFNKDALFAQGAYFGENADGTFNTEIDPVGNIHTARNVEAGYGVAAYGMASLAMNGGGGQGTVTAINFAGSPEQIYTPSDGLITLPDYPSLDGYATQAWVTNNFADKAFEGRVTAIESKIPAQASSTNQLADKDFVNSSVATATAEFQGTYDVVEDLGLSASATHAQIQSALLTAVASKQPDNNDYVFVSIPAVSGASGKYERYKFNGTAWAYEYTLNNSSFTAAQWASITSGITSAKVSDYDTHIARTDNPHNVTKAQVGLGNVENTALSTWTGSIKIVTLGTINTGVWHGSAIADDYIASASAWNAKYDKPSGGIPKTDLASAVQTSLGKADTALQSHQTIYNLTIKKNGVQVGNVYNPASAAQTIDITDVASASALSGVSTRVGTLEGYFTSGVANNAAQLGGQLPSYYAAAADYTKTSDFKSFSINVGATSLGTYSPTSALIISLVAGTNISFTPDATNHKLTINNTYSYTLPIASSDSRGGIRVGNTLTIDSNGILNARIYDGLDSGSTTYALSAKQGKALNTALDTLKTGLTSKGAHNLPIYLNSSAEAVTIDSLSVPGDIQSTAGGVAASGIASLAMNGGGGQGTLTQIQVNGVALADTSGVVNITATTGNANGKIAIAGQQIPVYGLGSLAYLSSLAFTDLSSHPTTLGGYGITDAKIANGVITLGGNTITPLTSHQTLYNLVINNSAGTAQITYKPAVSGTYALTLTKAMVGLSNVENTKLSTWTGSTNITTLGTITTGKWQGTAIADSYIASAATWNAKQDAISDLATIRSNASNGNTAYGWGNHADAGYFAASSFTKANIKSTLGISDWALAASKPSYAFSEITGTVTNAQLAGSIANSKLASAGKFTIGSTAIELGTTYTAANFRSYLGLGGAATYGATSSVTDGGTSLVTSGGVYSYVNALLTAAMKIEGETTTAISDGSTTNPVTIGGQSVNAYKGMVVFYGSKEFVWVGTNWKELGDESSFALKTTTVSGTGYLTGGGALSSNQTIDIASSVKTKIDNGATAYGWGNHANAGYALAANLGTASTHAHGDYVTALSWDSTNNKLAWSKGGTAQTAITIGYASSAGKLNTNAGSATNPVYFANGVPVACTYSLNKTVPADAVFTDTNTKVTQTVTNTGNTDRRPILLGYSSSASETPTFANQTETVYAANRVFVKPSTGDLFLYNPDGGDSPFLYFQRGDFSTAAIFDWRMYVSGGNFHFQNNYNGWHNALSINYDGVVSFGSNTALHSGNSSVSKSGETLTVKINGTSQSLTNTNTHRPIQLNGTEILGNNTTALNLKAGTGVSLTNSSGTVTFDNSGVRAATINGNYLRINTNGTNADLTIPYATNAGTASKVGSSTVGSSSRPIYLNSGTATAVDYLDHSYVAFTGRNLSGYTSVLDKCFEDRLKCNSLASFSSSTITIERSSDGGSTWTAVDYSAANKLKLFRTESDIRVVASGNATTSNQVRITLNAERGADYINFTHLLIDLATEGATMKCEVSTAPFSAPTTFTKIADAAVSGWSGWNSINAYVTAGGFSGDTRDFSKYIRFRFYITGVSSSYTNNFHINSIRGLGGWDALNKNYLSYWGRPYNYDEDLNITFPANVTARNVIPSANDTYTLGTSSLNWNTINTHNVISNTTLYLQSATDTSVIVKINGGTEIARFSTNGNFGVGTTAPAYKADINGTANATTIYENGTALSSKYLGINANAVSATKLANARTIWGQSFDGTAAISGNMTGVGTINKIIGFDSNGTNAKLNVGEVSANINYIHLYVSSQTSSYTNERPLVLQNGYGNVGIGVAQPSNKLDVAGAIGLTGQLKSTVATGTAPLVVASTTAVTNLNADLLDGQHGSYYAVKAASKGSTTKPIYTDANGAFQECNTYAGGTAVTLNGTSKAASTASFYAPTGAGTSDQILKSTAGTPEWINQSALVAGKATILETTRTIWGQNFNGSANVTGDMSSVGNIAFSASGKNIGGTLYFDTTNHRVGINDSTPSCAFDVTGDIQASGGVAAGGILNLAYNGAGTQGTLTQIQVNGRALTDSSGIVNIPLANTTSTGDGAMSHTDKLKLDGIATGATNVTTDTVAGWGYIKDAAGIANALGYTAARENKKSRLVTGSEYRFQPGDNDCINIWIVSEANVNLYLPYDWDYQTPLRLIIANAYSGTVTVKYKATSGTQKIYSQSDSISLSVGRAALVEMIQFYNASVGGELTFITSSSYLQRSIT